MKPIYILTLHRPNSVLGGIQKHIDVFRNEMRFRGVEVILLTPFHAPKVIWTLAFGIGKLLAAINGSLYAKWYEFSRLKLLQYVLSKHVPTATPVIIYTQDPVSLNAALTLKRRNDSIEVVNAIHFNLSTADEWAGKGIIKYQGRVYRHMLARDERVFPKADRLVFVSEFMRDQLHSRLPAMKQVQSRVVPNFVPSIPFAPDTVIEADLITIGTLEPRKNQAFLLQALRSAHDQGHHYRLSIVGDGPSRRELEELSKKLGLNRYVTFLGALSNAADLIQRHRAYVHSAKMESFGIVLVEALAAGKPVFAAPVGGIKEVFDDGIEGCYWSLDNPEEAAAKIIGVLNNPKRYCQMVEAAKARHANLFSTQAVQEKLLAAVVGTAAPNPKTFSVKGQES